MAKRYPQSKIDEALLAHFTLGDVRKASDASGVPFRTLARWVAETHIDRYRELAERHGARIEQHLADRMLIVASHAAEATTEAIEATQEALAHGKAEPPRHEDFETPEEYEAHWRNWVTLKTNASKDASALSTAARNLVTVAGISTDKRLILTGRPTQIHQHSSAEDDLRALARMFNVNLEGTATEVPNEADPSPLTAQSDSANAREVRELEAA